VTTEACRRWRETLGAYLLGHLTSEERVGLEAHLDGCADCRTELEELRPVSRSLSSADPSHLGTPPPPPPELADRVFARVRAARRAQRRRRWSIAVAAAVAAVAIAVPVTLALLPESSHSDIEKFQFQALPAGVVAEATLYKRQAGVEVWIEYEGLTPGATYAVWVERPSGERVKCGEFVTPKGKWHFVVASTVTRLDTAAVGVSTAGVVVMRAPVSPPKQA
jgi:predicted anti-sigma-YlaC factor YlaD